MSKKKAYLLYDNKEQNNLLAAAYSKEEIEHESQYYTKGVWFSYDHVNNIFLENESIYRDEVNFPEIAKERAKFTEKKEVFKWK